MDLLQAQTSDSPIARDIYQCKMSGKEGSEDPFARRAKLQRSPPGRSYSLPGEMADDRDSSSEIATTELQGLPDVFGDVATKKRKAMSPTQGTVDASQEVDETEIGTQDRELVNEMRAQLSDLTRYANGLLKGKRLTVLQHGELINRISDLRSLARDFEVKISFLEGRLNERLKIERDLKSSVEAPMPKREATYAEMTAFPKLPGVKMRARPSRVVFVRSKDDKLTIDQVKDTIKESVKPSELGINVKRVTKTARGLMIETEGLEQLEKLEKCHVLTQKGLIVEKPKKRLPRLMIYDVEQTDNDDIIVEDIFTQNYEDSEIDKEVFKNEFRCVHKYKRKDPNDTRTNWVVECSARVRNLMRLRDRIYIGWQSCRLKDYNPLVRCFKCQSYGHTSRVCRGRECCPHCAGEHDITKCPRKGDPPRCANCVKVKKDHQHAVNDPKCTELQRATRIAFERIDYGV